MAHPYMQAIEVFEKDIDVIREKFNNLGELEQKSLVNILARDIAIERNLYAINVLHYAHIETSLET